MNFEEVAPPLDLEPVSQQITLSDDQQVALDQIVKMAKQRPFVTLGGYAGTGKSTIIPFIADAIKGVEKTAFAAYTGKASNVLKQKLQAAGCQHALSVGTIHSLMYKPILNEHGDPKGWERKKRLIVNGAPMPKGKVSTSEWNDYYDSGEEVHQIVIDEASMVGKKTLEDLRSFGVPIVCVGDPAQLPPIEEDFVMADPDVVLSTIHRQAADNPIIQLASFIRENGNFPKVIEENDYIRVVPRMDELQKLHKDSMERLGLNTAMLCARNNVRAYVNRCLFGKVPQVGHQVICLKNQGRVTNGMRGVIREMEERGDEFWRMKVSFDEDGFSNEFQDVMRAQFLHEKTLTNEDLAKLGLKGLGSRLDFGACITTHKAQGSSFEDVYLVREGWPSGDLGRAWLYTAVTRSSKRLFIHFK
jgi:exodeoxyribonuclease-5